MRKKQSGVFLVSAAIAVAVAGTLITFWGVNYSRQMRVERAERVGEALKVIGNAVDTFTVMHHDAIVKAFTAQEGAPEATFSINGVTFGKGQTRSDGVELAGLTAETLIKALQLPGVSSEPPPGVGEYRVRIYADCDATRVDQGCNIHSLTYLTAPMKRNYSSKPDLHLAAVAARKIGAFGGLSTDEDPAHFRFVDASNSPIAVSNPEGEPGIVAIRGGAQTSTMKIGVRRDGSLPMTGHLTMKNKDEKGDPVNYNIVGAGKIEAKSLDVDGTGNITGGMNVGGDLTLTDKKKNNIVGAGKIGGESLDVKQASVGALTASEGATFSKGAAITGGELRISDADAAITGGALTVGNEGVSGTSTIVASDRVESEKLRSNSGIVELSENAQEGASCNIWGISRDSTGRVMSCQNTDGGARVWKLSSPRSKDDVPDQIVKEITKEIYRDEKWTITEFDLSPYMWLETFAAHTVQYELKGARRVIFCTLDSQGKPNVDGVSISYRNGSYHISGPTRRPVVCLAKGNGASSLVLRRNTDPYASMVIRPSRYTEDMGEVNAWLERLVTPTAPPSLVNAQTMLGGLGMRGSDTVTRIEGATSCSIDWPRSSIGGYGGKYRFAPIFEADTDGTPMLKYSSMDSVWVSCNFRTAADARRIGFPI